MLWAIGVPSLVTANPKGMPVCPGKSYFSPGDITNFCHTNHFWSFHQGGANMLFADGSVRLISYSASLVMPALATIAGGEVVNTSQF